MKIIEYSKGSITEVENVFKVVESGAQGPTGPVGPFAGESHALLTDIGTNTHAQIDAHMGGANPHSGSAASGANSDITSITGLTIPLSIPQGGAAKNNSTTTAPTVTDDSASGYSQFSEWINITTLELYKCFDATAGNALWGLFSQLSGMFWLFDWVGVVTRGVVTFTRSTTQFVKDYAGLFQTVPIDIWGVSGARWSENLIFSSVINSSNPEITLVNGSGNATFVENEVYLEVTGDYLRIGTAGGWSTIAGDNYIIGVEVEPTATKSLLMIGINDTFYQEIARTIVGVKRFVYFKITAQATKSNTSFLIRGNVDASPTSLKLYSIQISHELPSTGNTDVLMCLGDSITFNGYTDELADYLPDATVVNEGIAGNKLADMKSRLGAALASSSPDIIPFLGGINDIHNTPSTSLALIESTYISIIDEIIAFGATPLLMEILPFGNFGDWDTTKQALLDDVNAFIVETGATYGLHVMGTWELFVDTDGVGIIPRLTSEGLHLSSYGNNTLAWSIGEYLDRLYPTYVETSGGAGVAWFSTDLNGFKCHPTDSDGIVEFLTERVNSTPYAASDRVHSGGFALTCTVGGTSDSTIPVIISADLGLTVADNDITWAVDSWYQDRPGYLGEGVAENVILQSRDPNTTWVQRGTFSAVQDLIGADGVANSGWTLSGIDASIVGDTFQTIAGLVTASRYEPSLVLKQITAVGVISVTKTAGAGGWSIDLSKLSTEWEVVDRNHPAVQVSEEFDTIGGTSLGIKIFKTAGTGTLSVGYHNSQLELGEYSSSQIETTTIPVSRGGSVTSYPSTGILKGNDIAVEGIVTPEGAGQVDKVLFSSYTDADNYLHVIADATTISLHKVVGGVDKSVSITYSHLATSEIWWQVFLNSSAGLGIRTSEIIDGVYGAWEAWDEDTDVIDAVIASTFQIGSQNSLVQFDANYPHVRIEFNSDPKTLCEKWGS